MRKLAILSLAIGLLITMGISVSVVSESDSAPQKIGFIVESGSCEFTMVVRPEVVDLGSGSAGDVLRTTADGRDVTGDQVYFKIEEDCPGDLQVTSEVVEATTPTLAWDRFSVQYGEAITETRERR